MKEKKKLKLKKYYLHPITTMYLLIFLIIVISGILSGLEMQATYNTVNPNTGELVPTLVTVENLLNYDGMKYIFSNAARNFISFAPLSMMLIALIGVSVAESTGLIKTVIKRHLSKLNKRTITFLLIFVATISTLINEIGYVVLIPLGALLFLANDRNPLAGIVASFCGVAFGYGVTLFVGSLEVGLIPYTTSAARLIDETFHVSLTSNLIIIIVTSILLSIVGTIIVEKIIVPKIGRYRDKKDLSKTEELEIIDIETEEQTKIEEEKREKTGLRYAMVAGIVVILSFIYMIIPNLPLSGMLLDMNEKTYLNQLFGENSYFQDGFTFMMSLLFLIMGIAYGVGSKTIKSDKDVINGTNKYLERVGELIFMIFAASQLIAIFKKTNIGTILTAWCANFISDLSFTGIPLIVIVLIMIAISNLFLTTPTLKWAIFSPVVVPALMQSNISPQFAQFILRAGDSMTNGITPLLAYFAIFVGYLNIYNLNKDKPITIRQAISMVMPYCLIISVFWILLVLGWYLIGLPIGPGVFPTI